MVSEADYRQPLFCASLRADIRRYVKQVEITGFNAGLFQVLM